MFYMQVRFKTASYLYGLSQTWLETKFHVPKSRNKDLVDNGILILPHHVFIDMVGLKLLVIFTRLAQTWLETKFHLSKARNQVWVNNGILILPRCASFIGNSG